jgi:hypothetical protein
VEKQVIFRDRQEAQAGDFNNAQDFARQSLDHIVRDGIVAEKAFAGFLVTQTSATEIEIAPGRLYRQGAVFEREDTQTRDLFSFLPVAVKRIVTVVGWGQEIETDVQPRDFLVDAETRLTEPAAVAMERRRYAMVETVAGVESAAPQPPILDAALLAIAHVTLGTTGILSIEMLHKSNGLPNLSGLERRVADLEAWRAITEPRITTIASDIAALALAQKGLTSLKLFTQAAQDIAYVKDVLNIADGARDYASDNFLTPGESDEAATGYDARAEEGIRFAWAAANDSALDLFNPLDAGVKLSADGLLLPAHTHVPRLILDQYAGDLSVSQYQFQTHSMVQKTMSRIRVRFGPAFTVCTNAAFWMSGMLGTKRIEKNPGDFHIIQTLTKDGEVFEIENANEVFHQGNKWARLRKIWFDTVEVPYWEKVKINHSVNGSQVGQTFLNSQDGWLTQVELGFTKLGPDGAVHITVCECYRGAPDLEAVLAHITVQRSALKLYPQKTVIDIPPTFVQAGGRYAILVTTGGNHYVATVSGADYAQGTLFYSTDGAYFQADLTRDLMLTLNFARFNRAFVMTDLKPLQLAGGITAIDLLHEGFSPASCELRYEVQVSGQWFTLDQYSADCLASLPALLPLRVVFVGTRDVMPGVRLTGSRARVSRPKTTFKHYSIGRTLSQATSQVKVSSRLEAFNSAAHSCTIKLKVGASEIAASSVVDVVEDVADQRILRTATFNLGAPTSAYAIIHEGTTTAAQNTFHVAQRYDQSF